MKAIRKDDLKLHGTYRCLLSGKIVLIVKHKHNGYRYENSDYEVQAKYFNDLTGFFEIVFISHNQLVEIE